MKSGTFICFITIFIGFCLISSLIFTLDEPHCMNCEAKVDVWGGKEYCPFCGHKLDSVYVYDEIDRIKFERTKRNEK